MPLQLLHVEQNPNLCGALPSWLQQGSTGSLPAVNTSGTELGLGACRLSAWAQMLLEAKATVWNSSSALGSWVAAEPACSWPGVVCGPSGLPLLLDLSNMDIKPR